MCVHTLTTCASKGWGSSRHRCGWLPSKLGLSRGQLRTGTTKTWPFLAILDATAKVTACTETAPKETAALAGSGSVVVNIALLVGAIVASLGMAKAV